MIELKDFSTTQVQYVDGQTYQVAGIDEGNLLYIKNEHSSHSSVELSDVTFLVLPMTNEHLNIELSKLLGKTTKDATQIYYGQISKYAEDHKACLEAQNKALNVDQIGYIDHLKFTTGHKYEDALTYNRLESMLRATPRQRAEAAYMTLRKEDQL